MALKHEAGTWGIFILYQREESWKKCAHCKSTQKWERTTRTETKIETTGTKTLKIYWKTFAIGKLSFFIFMP